MPPGEAHSGPLNPECAIVRAAGDPPGEFDTHVKVAWLKQKRDDDRLPLLDFDEQQFYTFDRRRTTFRMVKHSCSYPAPPHKVRMWCSSLGASPDLPSTMDLNTFINTFELITEEKHTLEMAHLTGGETIAFEMVQGEHASELSTFLLGAQPPKAGVAERPAPPHKADAASSLSKLASELDGSVGKVATELEVPRERHGLDSSAPVPVLMPVRSAEERARLESVLREEEANAERTRRKLADELIAEEEEEVRQLPPRGGQRTREGLRDPAERERLGRTPSSMTWCTRACAIQYN